MGLPWLRERFSQHGMFSNSASSRLAKLCEHSYEPCCKSLACATLMIQSSAYTTPLPKLRFSMQFAIKLSRFKIDEIFVLTLHGLFKSFKDRALKLVFL